MIGTRVGKAATLGLMLVSMAIGGCASVSRDEYDMALQENNELRQQLSDRDGKISDLESRLASAESEKQNLSGELDKARQGGGRGDTGFSGDGVTATRVGNDVVVGVAGDVLFDSGQATLKSSSRRTLDNIASVLNSRYGSNQIRVEGYTDTDPIRRSKWESNEHLSAMRALSVEKYLVSKGVSNSRIYSAAFGPANPRSTKAQSRRVEIVILGGNR